MKQRPPLHNSHCGVLRLENLPRVERKILLNDALNRHGKDLESGANVPYYYKLIAFSQFRPGIEKATINPQNPVNPV